MPKNFGPEKFSASERRLVIGRDERTRNVSCSGSVLVLLENYFNVLFCSVF